MKIKIGYTWHDLGRYAKEAVISLLTGFCKTLWAVALTIANIAIRGFKLTVSAIRRNPCTAVVVTFLIMAAAIYATHMRMKVKLTTAEYQRDSIEQKLDSIKVLYGDKIVTYQAYKEK